MTFVAANTTQRRARLAMLAREMRTEADKYRSRPEIRDRLIANARQLSWTFRTLSHPASVDEDVVDALIDASIEIIVHFASERVPWKVADQ